MGSQPVLGREAQQPFPDYVTCPQCGEPEVEVWCYAPAVRCHACGQMFEHALPQDCVGHCDRTTCKTEHPHNPIKFS
jgi:hypothetical protein